MSPLHHAADDARSDGGFAQIMAAAAAGRAPAHRIPIRFADKRADLVAFGDEMAGHILPLFAHLAETDDPTAPPGRTIAFVDAEAVGFGPAPAPGGGEWAMEGDGWRIATHHDARYLSELRDGSLICLDRATGSVAALYRSARGMTLADRGRPLQRTLYQMCLTYGAQNVHAGLVARNGTGVLIVGARGRGKTTTSLDCLLDGLDFLGDDSVAIQETDDGGFRGLSLYGSARVFPGQVDRWPEIRESWRFPGPGDDKAMLHPGRIAPERMRATCAIAAILVPQVAGGAFRTREISPRVAFNALVHESEDTRRFRMSPAEFHRLARFTRETPCILCELDASPAAVAAGVASVIDRLSG